MTKDSNSRHRRRVWSAGAAVAVAAVLLAPGIVAATPGSATDADDVTLRLDLKTVSHSDDGATITLTSQTYEAFKDEWADFKWGIDKDGDESFDLLVFAEWEEDELVGGVDDSAEEPVSLAQVTRPGPDSIAVSFSAKILGKSTSYRYGALAATDLNGNGEEDAGETDVAPDSGLYSHALTGAPGSAAPAPATATAVTPKAAPKVAADTKPAVAPKREATPAPATASRKPAAVPAPKPASAAPAPPAKAAAPAPVVKPAPAPEPAAVAAVTEPAGTPAAAPNPALAKTGPLTDTLLILAGLVLLVGGTFFILESVLPRTARH
jgi:hypothetical protein